MGFRIIFGSNILLVYFTILSGAKDNRQSIKISQFCSKHSNIIFFFSRIYVWIFWVLNATEVAIPFLFSLRLGWINEITELYRINYLRILQTWFLVHKHFQLSSGMKWWKFSSSLKIEEWIELNFGWLFIIIGDLLSNFNILFKKWIFKLQKIFWWK